MMGAERKENAKLFYYDFSLEERIPEDHILRRVNELVDFGFVRRIVARHYGYNGHVSEDPIVIVKLMFLLFFERVKSERELMRVLPMRLDWLWFLNMELDSTIPHHSVLSKARRRWGREVFEELFIAVVEQCVAHDLVEGSKIHLDGSLVDADASRDKVGKQSLRRIYRNEEMKLSGIEVRKERKVVSRTDPDAVVVRKGRRDEARPRYKNHRAVDDRKGVITAVRTSAADRSEPHEVPALIKGHEESTGKRVRTVVGDHQYGTNENYRFCGKRKIRCHLGDVKTTSPANKELYGLEDFDYEAQEDRYRCPAGNYLKRYRTKSVEAEGFADYRMPGKSCQSCSHKSRCTTSKYRRRLKVPLERELVERGRAEATSWEAEQSRRRRKHLIEGSFGDAANSHHFKRARWRGLNKQRIQDLLVAVCQNVRILCSQTVLPPVESNDSYRKGEKVAFFGPIRRWIEHFYRTLSLPRWQTS